MQVSAASLLTLHLVLRRFQGKLEVGDIMADPTAHMALTFAGAGSLLVDVVSLLPEENVAAAGGGLNPWPFRADLLQMLKDLRPRHADRTRHRAGRCCRSLKRQSAQAR